MTTEIGDLPRRGIHWSERIKADDAFRTICCAVLWNRWVSSWLFEVAVVFSEGYAKQTHEDEGNNEVDKVRILCLQQQTCDHPWLSFYCTLQKLKW